MYLGQYSLYVCSLMVCLRPLIGGSGWGFLLKALALMLLIAPALLRLVVYGFMFGF